MFQHKVIDLTVDIMFGSFTLEGNPLLYEGICIAPGYCIVCIIERDYERVKRKLQRMCCRWYPFILLDNIKEGVTNFSLDIVQIK